MRQGLPLHSRGNKVVNSIHRDYSSDSCTPSASRSDIRDQMPTRGFTNESNLAGIHLIHCSVLPDKTDGGLYVIAIVGKLELWRKAIVDAEPGKPGITWGLEIIGNVFLLALCNPSPSMDQDGGRKRAGAV